MDFLELAKERYSVRIYSDEPVEEEKINKILEAGRIAPTAHNNQPQRIYVIQSKEAREKVKKCTRYSFNAPIILLLCYDEDESWFGQNDRFGSIDPTIVGTHMMLEATELGLGTVWVGSFNAEITKSEFALPSNIIPVAFLPLGYPFHTSEPSAMHNSRKKLLETVRYL
jgi:nitroreductase